MRLFSPSMPWRAAAAGMVLMAASGTARAQDGPRIISPQPGQAVRGEITAQFAGVPEGGYLVIKIDDLFRQANSQPNFTINTFQEFPNGGTHRLSITAIDASGRTVGTAEVSFEVANGVVNNNPSQGVVLRHWTLQDRINQNVQRFRVFAESNADIEEGGSSSGGGGRGSSGGGGGGGGESESIPAPLDWQVVALVRRVVRDVGMVDGAANIRYAVAQSFQRQRLGESGGDSGSDASGGRGGGGSSSGRGSAASGPPGAKAPWNYEDVPIPGTRNTFRRDLWDPGTEVGQYFVKMVRGSGDEINATRKKPTVALADLLPTFPQEKVFPGSTWLTSMTFVGELSKREPITVRDAPMSFSNFETVITPAGVRVRCAKLESYFNLPPNDALELAGKLNAQAGSSSGGSSGGSGGRGGGSGGGSGGDAAAEEDPTKGITGATTRVARIIYFDIAGRRIIRAEDTVNTFYQVVEAEAGSSSSGSSSGGARGGGGGGGAEAPAEPTKVNYNMKLTTYLDDAIPEVSNTFTGGAGTAHGAAPGNRDRSPAQDPNLDRVRR